MIEQLNNDLHPSYNRAARFAIILLITATVLARGSATAGETGQAIAITGPARAIVADPAGGVFAAGGGDATIVKIAPDGKTTALRQFGPSGSTIVGMAILADGSLVLAGSNFVVKTSSALQAGVQAAVPFSVRAIAAGPGGSVYLVGDHAVRKLGPDLGLLWQADNVTTAREEIAAIAVDGANHIYIAGKRFVSALAEGGQPLSRVPLNNCDASAMSVDASGSLYIAGTTPGFAASLAPSRACVSKLSFSEGRTEWSAAVAGSGFSMVTAIAVEPGGNVVITGVTNSKYLPHASGTLAGRTGGFAARFDRNGVLLNAQYIGSGTNSELDGVAVDNNGQAWVAGWSDAGRVQALVSPVQWSGQPGSTPAARAAMVAEAQKAGQPTSVVAGANAVCAPNLTVTSTADSGPGTLRDAVANACAGAIITFSLPNPSTIALTTGSIHVLTPIAILGPGAPALTIDGGSQSRIFYVSLPLDTYDGDPVQVLAIDGLTLANGLARGGNGEGGGGGALGAGGAIYLDIGAMSVTNVVFRNNRAVGGNGSLNDTGAAGGGGGGMGGNGAPGASANANLGNGNGGTGGSGGDLGGSGGAGGSGATPGLPSPGGQGGPGAGGGGGAALLGLFAAGGPGGFGGGGGGAGVGNATLASASGGAGGFGGGGGAGVPSVAGIYGGNGFGEAPNSQGGGGGGAGLGGAIFSVNPYQAAPILGNLTFTGNSATGGAGVSNQYGASGAGQGKGGALWGQALTLGALNFMNNSASDAGSATGCFGTSAPVDTPDLCGDLIPTGQFLAVAGDAQSAMPNSAFATNLSVHVQITQGINVSGLPVTFTAPAAVAGQPTATFPGGGSSVTVLTDANGNATAPVLTANATAGTYTVTASYGPVSVPFLLANGVPVGATLTSATPVQNNGYILTAVLQTAGGQPIGGTVVHFIAPGSGPTGSFVGGASTIDQTTDVNGKATVTFVPNSVPGPISISASVGQLNTAFNLINQFNLSLVTVSPLPNNRTNISLKVTYPWGAAASGVPVSYTAPSSGPSGTTKNLTSDGSGNINAEFDGNNIPGSYNVSFTIAYSTGAVQVPITNIQYNISLIGVGVAPFSALLGQFFQNTMFVAISGGPVSTVTFSTPGSQTAPGGTFNGQFSASTVPDSGGSTTVPPLLANKVAGTWPLRISLNPNLYQDFNELTNVQANITTQTTLSLDSTVGLVSDSYSYKVVVNSGSATGKVTVYAGGSVLQSCTLSVQAPGSQASSNTCGGTFKMANPGTYQLTASYAGDLNNSPSNSAAVNLTLFAASGSTTFTTVTVTTSQPTTTGSNNDCNGFATGGALLFPLITCGGSNGSTSFTAAQHQPSAMKNASTRTGSTQPADVQSAPISYPIGNGPHTVATADFNGDGIPDWAVTNEPDGTVSILLGNANGTLQSAVTYPAGTAPAGVVTGDFNHDGKQDWAVANSSGVISVALGLGNGTFTLPITFQGTGSISQMAAADVNGDGFTDLVALDSSTGAINVYLNNGTGLMTLVPNSQHPGSNPQALLLRDFNNDGKLDVAVAYAAGSNASTGQGTIAVLVGNGDGTFAAPKFLPGGQPISLAAAMYSGKGFLDLVAGYAGNNLVIYPGNGDGSFGSPISEPATNVTGILAGDFSGTGRTDIIALNGTTNVLHLVNQPTAGTDLTVRKSHTGMLVAGQTGVTYSIVVSNAGQTASNGAVTVTDVAPAGLTIKRVSGTGWTCTGKNVCTRTDALGGGQSYPAITVTADIATSAPYLLANTATVSGGGDTNALNNSSIDAGPVLTPQTITFAPIPDQVRGSILNLNSTTSSGLTVAYMSLTPLVCTVSGNTVNLVNLGTCKIQASQPGDSVYAPAPAISRSFDVLSGVHGNSDSSH